MLPIGLKSCPPPSLVLLLYACFSRRASGSMRILHFTALILLAGTASASPISTHALPRPNIANSTLPGITQTSIDHLPARTSTLPVYGKCRAFYFDPKDDVPCGVVARQFSIYLTYPESDQASTEQWCETFLFANGICRATSPNSPSAFPTSRASTLIVSVVEPTSASGASAAAVPEITNSASHPSSTTLSPMVAVVGLNGSIVSAADAASVSVRTTSSNPVVLATVRASEYSATVVRTTSNTSLASFEQPSAAPDSITPAINVASPSTSSDIQHAAINTTRTLNFTVSSGNATSVKTILVTAHLATSSPVTSPSAPNASAPALSMNSTLARRHLRFKRQAMWPAASTAQVFDAEQVNLPTASASSGLWSTAAVQVLPATVTYPSKVSSPYYDPLLALAPTSSVASYAAQVSLSSVQTTWYAAASVPTPSSVWQNVQSLAAEQSSWSTWSTASAVNLSSTASWSTWTAASATPPTASVGLAANASTTVYSPSSAEVAQAQASLSSVVQPVNGTAANSTTVSTTATVQNVTAHCSPPPGPTPEGGATQCAQWYVVADGDTCDKVAAQFGPQPIDFVGLNPTLDAGCRNLMAGSAYCVASCTAPTPTNSSSTTPPTYPAPTGVDKYTSYHGDGTTQQGWPQMSDWMSWEALREANRPNLATACTYWQVQENSDAEIDMLLDTVAQFGSEKGLDPRVVLAVMLQESRGCLRVPETMGSHRNPGVFQSHAGNGTCNSNLINAGEPGPMQDPSLVLAQCPSSEIETMVQDGALGTRAGDGLLQIMQQQQSLGYRDAQMWYRVARAYNSGSIDPSNVLEMGAATHAYASDIANRLLGWSSGPSGFAR